MLLIGVSNLWQEKTRLFISVAGVGFSITLMLILLGIYTGAQRQFTMVVERNPAQLFVSRAGITDFFHGVSVIEPSQLRSLEAEPRVERVVPVVTQRSVLSRGDARYDAIIFSTVPGDPMGAPWNVTRGSGDLDMGEVVLSDLLADKLGLQVGENVTMQRAQLRVSGLAGDASSFGNHYAWVTLRQARQMVENPVAANFAYVKLRNDAAAAATAASIQSGLPQLSVLDKDTFVGNNLAELEESFLPIIRAIVLVVVVIAVAVVTLTIYTLTMDKAREYGVLKAIGVTNWQLYRVVLLQSIVATTLGLAVGALLAVVVGSGLEHWINLEPVLTQTMFAQVAALSLAIGLVASLSPVWRLVRIEPAEVFRA